MVNNKKQKQYLRGLLLMVLIGLVIVASPLYVKGKEEVTEEIRQNPIESNVLMNLTAVSYNQRTHYMEATFNLENSEGDTPELSELVNLVYSIDVASKKNNQEYKPKVIRVDDQYLVVSIPNVSEEFDYMRFVVTPKSLEKSEEAYEPIKFYISQAHVKTDKDLKEGSIAAYEQQFVSFKQGQMDGLIKKQEAAIKKSNEKIRDNKVTIEKLNQEMMYQTTDEQEQTRASITSIEAENTLQKQLIEQSEKAIEKLQEKRKLVEEKYR